MSHQNTGEYLTAPGRFAYLLKALHLQTEKPVVVLVDEYDKPILDALEIPEVARANRNVTARPVRHDQVERRSTSG